MNQQTRPKTATAFRIPYENSVVFEKKMQAIIDAGWKLNGLFFYLATENSPPGWMILVCCEPYNRVGYRKVTVEKIALPLGDEINLDCILLPTRYSRTYKTLMPTGKELLLVGITKRKSLRDSDLL